MPDIFSASALPKAVREGFQAAISLPTETLQKIAQWLKANPDFIAKEYDSSDLERSAAALNLTEVEFAQALSLIGTLLVYGEHPGDIGDLKDLGLTDYQDKVKLLLAAVDISQDEIGYSRQKGMVLRSAIPTLDDVDALCDLRAVFARLPSASSSEKHLQKVNSLLGFEPVAIVSLQLNNAAGKDDAPVFQVSETGLRNLIQTLQETLGQLEIIKKAQKSLQLPKDTTT
jgi:hypothetical protein